MAAKSPDETAQAEIARYLRALEADPNNPRAHNELAWTLLFAPPDLQNSAEAVRLASRALELKPGDSNYRNTLGVALYRNGRFREAVDCLSLNLPSQNDEGLPFDLYYLAMSHLKLGEVARAKEVLVWAERWSKSAAQKEAFTASLREQLKVIQQEAHQLFADTQ
jgi:tetratricopeptide (TPR) repeat protein